MCVVFVSGVCVVCLQCGGFACACMFVSLLELGYACVCVLVCGMVCVVCESVILFLCSEREGVCTVVYVYLSAWGLCLCVYLCFLVCVCVFV